MIEYVYRGFAFKGSLEEALIKSFDFKRNPTEVENEVDFINGLDIELQNAGVLDENYDLIIVGKKSVVGIGDFTGEDLYGIVSEIRAFKKYELLDGEARDKVKEQANDLGVHYLSLLKMTPEEVKLMEENLREFNRTDEVNTPKFRS